MSDRPPVPTDLRRRILVEAGHRCAIPTCRYPNVDVHHIVPWERLEEHNYDNLIALCPNCHRRADRGEIDTKSLLLYKVQLKAVYSTPMAETRSTLPATNATVTAVESRWTTQRIVERAKEPAPYELEIEFPKFHPDEGELAELNLIHQANALQRLHNFRTFLLAYPPEREGRWAERASVLTGSFEVITFDRLFISIKYSRYNYTPGAAHGQRFTQTYNYCRDPLIPLGFEELFRPCAELAQALSDYSVRVLEAENGDAQPNEWVRKGTGPDLDNFEVFNLIKYGLLITFEEYQVGPYSDGVRHIAVPKEILIPFLRANVGLHEFWR